MKKKFLILPLLILALVACDQEEPAEVSSETETPVVTEVDEAEVTDEEADVPTEAIDLSTHDHAKFTLDYPSDLEIETILDEVNDIVRFSDGETDETIMELRVMEGNRVGFLEPVPTGDTLDFENGKWNVAVNETGYCDGPGCGAPFTAYTYYDEANNQSFVLHFMNQTVETESSKLIAESFSLKPISIYTNDQFSINHTDEYSPVTEDSTTEFSFGRGMEVVIQKTQEFSPIEGANEIGNIELVDGTATTWLYEFDETCEGPSCGPTLFYTLEDPETNTIYAVYFYGESEESDEILQLIQSLRIL